MDAKDFLWGMYQEHVTHARQHEDQRERMTGAVAALSAAALALAASAPPPLLAKSQAGVLLVVLGLYGALFSLKHYERFRRHVTFAGLYRNNLETMLKELPISGVDLKDDGDRCHLARPLFKRLAALRLHWFWVGLPLMIAAGGVLLLFS